MKKVQAVLKKSSQVARKKLAQPSGKILSESVHKLLRKHARQNRKAALRAAAAQMAEIYQNDRELTALSALDAEDFLPIPAPE